MRTQRFCSNQCSATSRLAGTPKHHRICVVCDAPFIGRAAPLPVTCSRACGYKYQSRYQKVCDLCGTEYTGSSKQKYCSRGCTALASRSPERSNTASYKRRASLAQVATEFIDFEYVCRRDKWICQLCNTPVEQGLNRRDPYGASLDHILPIVRGGPHIYANVQLAHLRCNMKKNDSVINDSFADTFLDALAAAHTRQQPEQTPTQLTSANA